MAAMFCAYFAMTWQTYYNLIVGLRSLLQYGKMQSESDSDSEFFDAPEKLSLSGSFTPDLRCVLILSEYDVCSCSKSASYARRLAYFFIIFSSLVHLFYLLPLTNFCWTVEFNISLIFMFRSILPLKTTISPSSFQSFHFLISLRLYKIISIFVDYLVVYCLFCFLFFSAQHDAKIVQKV